MTTPKFFPLLALLLVLPLALTACGGDGANEMHDHEMTQDAGPAEPRLEAGVQTLDIEAGQTGYRPRTIALEAGVPVRLVFTRTVDSECSAQVKIPAFDVPVTDLPLNEPIAVEFTPTEGGDFEFVCGMDMQRGSLLIPS